MKVQVIVIDDHEVVLAGLEYTLGRSDRCVLAGTYLTMQEALARIADPDAPPVSVALLDLRLADGSDPYLNALDLQSAGVHVLVYSSMESPYLVRRALQAGVAGVVDKSASVADLEEAVCLAAAGGTYATTDWAVLIDGDPLLAAVTLSERQREVLELFAMGEPAKRVATLTGLSQGTVQDYLGRIRAKYALAGRPAATKIELFLRAQEDGFLPGPLDR